jgi:hypothetical protein
MSFILRAPPFPVNEFQDATKCDTNNSSVIPLFAVHNNLMLLRVMSKCSVNLLAFCQLQLIATTLVPISVNFSNVQFTVILSIRES